MPKRSRALDTLPPQVQAQLQRLGYQQMAVGAQGHESSLDNALSACAAFGLSLRQARQELGRVSAVVAGWAEHFAQAGVAPRDIDTLIPCLDRPGLRA